MSLSPLTETPLRIHGLSKHGNFTVFSLNLLEHFVFHHRQLIGVVHTGLKKGIFFYEKKNQTFCRAIFPEVNFSYGAHCDGLALRYWNGQPIFGEEE
jgi:hypothetical protein